MYSEVPFKSMFEQQYPFMVRVAFGYTNSIEAAEEIVQDVFVDFWLRKDTKIENPRAYVRKAVIFKSIDWLRRVKRNLIKEDLSVVEEIVGENTTPEDILIYKERSQQLQHYIDQLPEKTRQVFMLSRYESMTYQEISELLKVSIKTIEYHISKALNQIRKALLALFLLFYPHF